LTGEAVIVVGAGIFGVTAALELRTRGYPVTIVDPGPLPHPAASSTDISKVIRIGYGQDDFYFQLMMEAMEGWRQWNKHWPRPLFHETGVMFLSRDEILPGKFEYENFRRLKAFGIPVQRITSEDLRERFPAWNSDHYTDGYVSPVGGWAESGEVVRVLLQEARSQDIQFLTGESFRNFLSKGSRVSGIELASGLKLPGSHVVLAAGAWTPGLLPELKPVMWPTAQDVLHFRVAKPSAYQPPVFPTWGGDVSTTGFYGFPADRNGRLKIANHGKGRALVPGQPHQVQQDTEARFRAFLEDALPEIAHADIIGRRVCFYCDTFDGDFWIAADPVRAGVLVASGGSGHGFKFAPVLGRIIADVLEGQANPWASRFSWRDRGIDKTEDARSAGNH
jgi:glycine/D-amino acid oxidase-like deaminating enzyme